MNDAYAAGLVDGEGCIYILRTNQSRQFAPRVDIGMTSKAASLLTQMKATYGGTISRHRLATADWDAAQRWAVQGTEAAAFLRRIQPYLVLKTEQARLALRAAEIRDALPKPAGVRASWTDEARSRCEILHKRIQELNRKGPPRPEPSPGCFARLVGGAWVTDQFDMFSDLGLESFSRTWPASGSMRNGACYRHAPWAPHTHETGCSFWPTPRANGAGSAGGSNAKTKALRNGTYITGRRNPNHTEWLMGFPAGWTETAPSATP